MKSTFNICFYAKKDKQKAGGAYPLFARITVDGVASRFNTKLDVLRSLVDTAVSPEDRLISPGLHEIWSKELNEIGRMLGGWKKSNE